MIRLSVSALRWRDLAWALGAELFFKLFAKPGQGQERFRAALAAALGRPTEAVWLTGAGRSALHAIVQATRQSPQDEALLPGYTCVVVPNVFMHLGLAVRYVDLAPGRVNPSLEDWLNAVGPNTRWVVVPHNFGVVSEVVLALRQRHPQLLVIEDAAHAWASLGPDRQAAGTRGHAAFFSFEYSKCLTTGLGGALLVNEPALRPAVGAALAGQHAMPAVQQAKVGLTLAYHLIQATWPARLAAALRLLARAPSRALGLVAATQATELTGASQPDYLQQLPAWGGWLGLAQLRRMPQVLALRRQQAERYEQALAGSTWLQALAPALEPVLPAAPGGVAQPVLLRFPLAVRDPALRDHLRQGLASLGIEPGEWFDDVVHPAGSWRHGYTAGACPQGERLARCVVNLPLGLHARVSRSQWAGLRALALSAPPPGS